MAAVTTAAVGTAVSAYGAYSANQRGRAAQRSQGQMHEDQMGLARDQMGFARDHYDWSRGLFDDYRQQFDPVLGELTDEAMRERTPDYGLITADTQHAFDSARGADQRALERYGINPGDGQWGANNRRYGIGQATAEVGARQDARRANQNDRYGRLAHLYGIGANLQGQAMGGMNTGMGAASGATGMGINAMGQAAGMYGQQAGMYGQMASDNMAGFSRGLNHTIDAVMNRGGGGSTYNVPVPDFMGGNVPINVPGGN